MQEISAPQKSFCMHFRTYLNFIYIYFLNFDFINLSWIFKKIHIFAIFSSIKTLLEFAESPRKDALKEEKDVLKNERKF